MEINYRPLRKMVVTGDDVLTKSNVKPFVTEYQYC